MSRYSQTILPIVVASLWMHGIGPSTSNQCRNHAGNIDGAEVTQTFFFFSSFSIFLLTRNNGQVKFSIPIHISVKHFKNHCESMRMKVQRSSHLKEAKTKIISAGVNKHWILRLNNTTVASLIFLRSRDSISSVSCHSIRFQSQNEQGGATAEIESRNRRNMRGDCISSALLDLMTPTPYVS